MKVMKKSMQWLLAGATPLVSLGGRAQTTLSQPNKGGFMGLDFLELIFMYIGKYFIAGLNRLLKINISFGIFSLELIGFLVCGMVLILFLLML